MANYDYYEIYAKGHPTALQFLENCLPCVDIPVVNLFFDADGCPVLYHRCYCKWGLDRYCTPLPVAKCIPWNVESFSTEDTNREDLLEMLCRLSMVQKSKVLQVKIQVHEWSNDSDCEYFYVYDCGEKLSIDEDPDFPWEDDVRESKEFFQSYSEDELSFEGSRLQASHFNRIYWHKNKNNISSEEWYSYVRLITPELTEWYQHRNNPPLWFRDDFPDYQEFCKVFNINPKVLKESMWTQIDENTYTLKYESYGSELAEIEALVKMCSDKQKSIEGEWPKVTAFAKMRSE